LVLIIEEGVPDLDRAIYDDMINSIAQRLAEELVLDQNNRSVVIADWSFLNGHG
jgi:hypothetical protein